MVRIQIGQDCPKIKKREDKMQGHAYTSNRLQILKKREGMNNCRVGFPRPTVFGTEFTFVFMLMFNQFSTGQVIFGQSEAT